MVVLKRCASVVLWIALEIFLYYRSFHIDRLEDGMWMRCQKDD